jgi:glycosyltransferase involved in cell wall biosynthesis
MHATRIALDITPLQTGHRFRGVGRYTRHLAAALAASPGDEIVYLLAYRAPLDLPPLPPRFRVRYLPRFARLGRAAALLSHQIALPLLLHRLSIDLFHALCLSHDPSVPGLPLVSPMPTVVTIHDLLPLHYPATLLAPWRKRAFYHHQLAAARRARHILTDSEHVRRDVIARLHIADTQVTAVPLGVSTEPILALPAAKEQPYILHVGGDYFNKNLDTLREAYTRLRAGGRTTHHLHLVGGRAAAMDKAGSAVDAGDVRHFTGLRAAELAAQYRGAALFAFPSIDEGFGLPPLEAMAYGVPVVAARAGALPEVLGDAACFVDSLDVAGWAAAMDAILRDPCLAGRLRDAGWERASHFPWSRTAEQTLAIYRAAARAPRL